MPSSRYFIPVALAVLSGACSDAASPGAVRVDTLAGGIVRTISNVPTHWAGTEGWQLVLEHTIQPSSDSPDLLSFVRQVGISGDSLVVVADGAPVQIYSYSLDGVQRRRLLARQGSGPGEVGQGTFGLLGDTLVIHDPPLARLTLMKLDGTLLTSSHVQTRHFGPRISVDRLGRVAVVDAVGGPDVPAGSRQWVRYSLRGERLDSILMPVAVEPTEWVVVEEGRSQARYGIPLAPATDHLLLASGDILFGRTDRDEFIVTRTGTDTVRIFGRTGATPYPVTDAEADTIFSYFGGIKDLEGIARRSDIPNVRPLWVAMSEDGAGNIWVRRNGPDLEDSTSLFDVYDSGGIYLGEVRADFASTNLGWTADRVVVADEDEDGLPRIRVYRIVRDTPA